MTAGAGTAGAGTAAAGTAGGMRPGQPSPAASQPVSPTASQVLRRLRFPLALAGFMLAVGAAVVLLQPHAGPAYLDPNDPGPFGSRALAQLLAQRGQHVVRVSTAAQAAASAAADSTLVVTGPAFLDGHELAVLGALPGDRVLVEPDTAALGELAPGVTVAGMLPVVATGPGCGLAAAQLAGNANMGGVALRAGAVPGTQRCYPADGSPSLIRYLTGGRTITVLGTGIPLTNGSLADNGNAALALNLLAARPAIVWLTPGTAPLAAARTGRSGLTGLTGLIPPSTYLVAIQLALAVLAAAAWRARRLGPLVTEPLPVVVRAAETVEGHGRLYRSRHSRQRAAEALRAAAAARLTPRLGLQAGAEPATIAAAVAARSGRNVAAVHALLFGPPPGTDAALVQLAGDLDALESEVRTT
jgi:Domain of unknown function (DUF4350)